MKKTIIALSIWMAVTVLASTNILQLTWLQPPGYQSTMYCATNMTGCWTSLGVVNPPYNVCPTNPVVFFYVSVAPVSKPQNYVGGTDPTNDAMAGSYFVNTNTGDWWVNLDGGANGWIWYIAGD